MDSGHLGSITATHADGQQLTLAFALTDGASPCNGSGPCELQSITRPDGQAITYTYDSSGDLTQVNLPGNNLASTVSETLSYSSPYLISQIANPRYTYSYAQNGGSASDGTTTNFTFFPATRQLQLMRRAGFVNFTPNDGTGAPLQPTQPSGYQTYYQQTYSGYTTTNCPVGLNNTNSAVIVLDSGTNGTTTVSDSDGHSTTFSTDACWRLAQTQESTGTLYLVTTQGWDASNDLLWSVEPRGNAPGALSSTYETDYAYDANGNTIAVALPSVSTNQGTFRPTSLYSYDAHNNLLSYCDPIKIGSAGYDWTNRPQSDSLCVVGIGSTGAAQYVWNTSDSNDLFGYLTDTYTPLGYHRAIAYNNAAQTGNYGLPTDVTGDPITQSVDNSTRTPHLTIMYDQFGNVICYSTFQDSSGTHWSRATYDSDNRQTASADADDASLSVPQCTNTPGIAGSYIQSKTTYNPNGTVASAQTPSEYAAGVSASFTYDADGNQVTSVQHVDCVPGGACPSQTTLKWYDGGDRLVEVQQPQDTNGHDLLSYPWSTRYLYDLSGGGTVTVDGATFQAHGNLFKTQEFAPSSPVVQANTQPTSPSWVDVRGASFDALDRPVAAYENAFGTTPKLANTYDSAGNSGLLSTSTNANGTQTSFSYAPTAWALQKQYLNDPAATPTESFAYDPDGRVTSLTSSTLGTEAKTYDLDGRLTSDAEAPGGGNPTPATLTYSYYRDGLRSALSVSSNALNQANIFQYAYRMDGSEETRKVNYVNTYTFGWAYTPAGALLTQNDPYAGDTVQLIGSDGTTVTGTRTFQNKQLTYDTYGRIASLALPEGFTYTFGSSSYDAEGNALSYTRSGNYCYGSANNCNPTRSTTLTARGELAEESDSNQTYPLTHQYAANGFMCPALNSAPPACADGYDSRNGMLLSDQVTYSYDGSGRQTQIQSALSGSSQNPTTAPMVRQYDAENHLISFSVSGGVGTNFWCTKDNTQMCNQTLQNTYGFISAGSTQTYSWGANGHLSSMQYLWNGGQSGTTYMHWDGDELLFASLQGGNPGVVLNVGDIGIENNGVLFVTDRDMDGIEVATHTSGEFGPWGSMPAGRPILRGQVAGGSQPSDPSWSAPAEFLTHVRGDGYGDGYGNSFQGVRVYDSNISQWTTPDAYAGDVHDPMTQKPYMWNRNNSLAYADPTGYDWGKIDARLKNAFDEWKKTPDGKKLYDKIAGDHHFTVDVIAVSHETLGKNTGGETQDLRQPLIWTTRTDLRQQRFRGTHKLW